VRIDCAGGVRLAVTRGGRRLKTVPAALRESGDYAWIAVALEAAAGHRRDLRALLETALAESVPLSEEDLALLALDPVGRPMLGALVLDAGGVTGCPLPDDWLIETAAGDLSPLRGPAVVVHPATLHRRGVLEEWDRWLSRRWVRQPFKQIRRELYLVNADDRRTETFSDRFAGETVRWDQARALLEGRGWTRVTKMGAERTFQRAKLAAFLEFRTPAARDFDSGCVVLNRIYFLPRGERPVNRARPGMPVEQVPAILYSETLRDAGLVAQVAARADGD